MSQGVQLKDVIFENRNTLYLDGRIKEYSGIEYCISPQKNSATISMLYYYASPVQCADIDKQINKWSTQGVIQESDSPWETLIIKVHQNIKQRLRIDYQNVNAVTLAGEYPLPRQIDILWDISKSQWFPTSDALPSSQQLEIVEEYPHFTALRTNNYKLLKNTQPPSGLCNGPAVFQMVINMVLVVFIWLFALVYTGHIAVYSQVFGHHVQRPYSVLGAVTQASIKYLLPKCYKGYQISFLLERRVSQLGIPTHEEKIDTIDAMKPPTKIKEPQMFLGFIEHFANYVPVYIWVT
jgi:hypothetical protein